MWSDVYHNCLRGILITKSFTARFRRRRDDVASALTLFSCYYRDELSREDVGIKPTQLNLKKYSIKWICGMKRNERNKCLLTARKLEY